MTRDEAREFAKRLRNAADAAEAFADGAEVQATIDRNEWRHVPDPTFNSEFTWRVKPKEPRHLWTVVNRAGYICAQYWDESKAEQEKVAYDQNGASAPYTLIHSIEVLP